MSEEQPDAIEQAMADTQAQILKQARAAVNQSIIDALAPLAEGAVEDLEIYGQQLARESVAAALAGDDITLQSIKRQAVILAETHRIRASNAAWNTVEEVTNIVLDTAFRSLSATLMRIR